MLKKNIGNGMRGNILRGVGFYCAFFAFGTVAIAATEIVSPLMADAKSKPITFSASKKALEKLYTENNQRTTLYAGCKYDEKKFVDKKSCGYKPKNRKNRRANKIEWEHVMPASWPGNRLGCWQEAKAQGKKSRKYCRKTSNEFNQMEGDMHNLFPAIGELNQYRSNYKFGDIKGENRAFGDVDFEVDSSRKTVEITYDAKGRVARTMLYMHWKYKVPLHKSDLAMYRAWNDQYPPSSWERFRERSIEQEQGNRNPFIYGYGQ